MTIRPERVADHQAIRAVNTAAFGGPAEAAIVDALRRDGLAVLSLVADIEGTLIGHILFSRLFVETATARVAALALAPMAVVPGHQRRGVGTALVREGLVGCRAAGETIVLVVGHPAYYPRFGFSHDLTRRLHSPFTGDAFMALELQPGALDGVAGDVRYPAAFGSGR
jgi:putative acetyltransferase